MTYYEITLVQINWFVDHLYQFHRTEALMIAPSSLCKIEILSPCTRRFGFQRSEIYLTRTLIIFVSCLHRGFLIVYYRVGVRLDLSSRSSTLPYYLQRIEYHSICRLHCIDIDVHPPFAILCLHFHCWYEHDET